MEMMKLLEMRAAAEVIEKYCDEYQVRTEMLKKKFSDNIITNNEALAEILIINSLLDRLLELQNILRAELNMEEVNIEDA